MNDARDARPAPAFAGAFALLGLNQALALRKRFGCSIAGVTTPGPESPRNRSAPAMREMNWL